MLAAEKSRALAETNSDPVPIMLEVPMPRYFFHLKYGNTLVVDEEGLCLHDLDRARVEVIDSIRQILGEPGIEHEDIDGQKLEISDETGETVLVVPF
jgi:hypothetical protein